MNRAFEMFDVLCDRTKRYAWALPFALTIWLSAISAESQDHAVKPLDIIREWDSDGTPEGKPGSGTISPNGTLEVHLGPRAFEDGLYISNLSDGSERKILESVGGYKLFDSAVFSPDGSHIAIRACPPLGADCGAPAIFTLRVDGEEVTKVSESRYDKSTRTEYRVGSPTFSPDGLKLMLDVEAVKESETLDENGNRFPRTWAHFVGIVSVSDSSQEPALVAQGKPLFWSVDGSEVYFTGKGGLAKLSLYDKRPLLIESGSCPFRPLGRIPNVNGAFVQCIKDRSIRAVMFDGSIPSERWQEIAAAIPRIDNKGRVIASVEGAGPRQLSIRFGAKERLPSRAQKQHVMLTRVE
jgi:hypothetical protein